MWCFVAIPSNRVNVSYSNFCFSKAQVEGCRNPLKSGQCFLPEEDNPAEGPWEGPHVAIPSNRVNVSY